MMMSSLDPINILLVDDHPENLLALEAVLSEENYNLIKASSGEMALRYLMKEEIAVIVLDVQMPGMDGIETAKWIKTREKTKMIPIIFVSANYRETKHLFAGYSAGGIDYMVKPFIPHILKSKINSFVGIYLAHKSLEAQKMLLKQKTFELERTNRELEAAKEDAERAAMVRTQFLAVVSHEIRTPLNGVMGMVDLLLDTELSEEQRSYGEMIRKSGNSLMKTINNMLDFTKMESGKVELEDYPFHMQELIDEVLEMFLLRTEKAGLVIKTKIDENVPDLLIGDMARLRQVLINLIGNAVKFTEQGMITIRVRALEQVQDGGKSRIEFDIEDTGIGIPEEKLPQLFQPFVQLDSSMNRRYGGTGLGLIICKTIIQLMGGEIQVHRQEAGTLFRFHVLLGHNGNKKTGCIHVS